MNYNISTSFINSEITSLNLIMYIFTMFVFIVIFSYIFVCVRYPYTEYEDITYQNIENNNNVKSTKYETLNH